MAIESKIGQGFLASGSIRFKALLIILLLLVVSVIVTLNLFFYQTHESEMAFQINAQQTIIAKSIALSIDSTMSHLKEEVISLSGLLSERGLHKKGLKGFVGYAFEELSEDIKVDIVLFDTKGAIIYSTREDYSLSDKDRKFYEGALTIPPRQVNMLPSLDVVMNLKVITPIRRHSDLIGAVMMILNIDDFNNKFLLHIMAGERGHAWIMDEKGTLLYHPTMPEMVGRNIRTPNHDCFECHRSFNAELQILESPDVGFSSYIAPYGEDKLLAFARTSEVGWIVCLSIPYSEVTASMKNSSRLQSLLVITFFLSTLGVAFVIIMINRQRLRAEDKANYADKLQQYATSLEEVVNERTKELKTEKEKLDTVIGSISAGICIFDEKGSCTWMNKVMMEWLGHESAELVSLNDIFNSSPEKAKMSDAIVHNDHVHETTSLDLGNKSGTFQVSVSPLHMPDGSTQRLMLLQDVTDLKMAEEQMIQSDKLAALSRLSAGVSHEIGNPLTSISSYVQILMDMEFDEFAGEALETISKHIKRIEKILRKMSVFSRSTDLDVCPHVVSELVSSTVDLVKYDRRTKDIDIVLDIPDDIPPVNVNGGQMVQIITNLILNASDAMSGEGRLTISATHTGSDVRLFFTDTGHGISGENLKRVFDPFFTTKQTGTGLGLAVSHSIVKGFGGDIEVKSEVGKGSTFIVRLPAYEE